MLKLGLNIDHVATLREARYRGREWGEPDPVAAALVGEMAGAVEEFKMQAIARAERDAATQEAQNKASSASRRVTVRWNCIAWRPIAASCWDSDCDASMRSIRSEMLFAPAITSTTVGFGET